MKNCLTSVIVSCLVFISILPGCEKKTDTDPVTIPSEYMNLQVGKYVRYILDSTRFVAWGQKDTVIRYQAKDVVEAQITDNLGRESYRVVRYLRAPNSTNELDWKPATTYMVTPTTGSLEVVENNLRFVKLVSPMHEGFSWKGNRYLPPFPYKELYDFGHSFNVELQAWDYTYEEVGATLNINNKDYDNTITVAQIEDSLIEDDGVGNVTRSTEKYARNIGLIFKELRMWEQQPPIDSPRKEGYRHGFGIKMTILDHN
jgi:hypothetical protein